MVGFGKQKKSSKKRGTREHGRGRKAGRGAGLRGGRGNAGAHKHKRVHYFSKITRGTYWGNHGFKRPEEAIDVKSTINLQDIDEHVDAWVESGKATKDGDTYTVDLAGLDVDKLLGNGQVRRQLAVTVAEATPAAVRKIEAAGGSVSEPAAAE